MTTATHTTSASTLPATWGSLLCLSEAISQALEESVGPASPGVGGLEGTATAEAFAKVAALAIGQGRRVKRYTLSDIECESLGLPYGTSEPCVYTFPLAYPETSLWDSWDDGECLHVSALGWTMEIHHEARPV